MSDGMTVHNNMSAVWAFVSCCY